ncbi:uncharacterized protein LOC143905683 [Temnothorax americanus]|uniref:uncharacterized protein LOC143905683 n=1 Tax=Temnothorax americanus TaxID=1964332 RepID=UPI0040679262
MAFTYKSNIDFRTLIGDYKTYQGINFQTNDMYKALSLRAKEIAKKYVRFTLRGKLGRTVPVLLTAELRDCIEMILKHRKAAKVSSKNPYLFGLPLLKKDNHKYLLACDLLRQYAVDSGAENPDTIRGTQLRKHIATTCIHYNLSENEISTLANFMGHADKIHLSHYRQPVIEKEILEISQYLEAAQGVDMDESDSNDSDSGLSDIENTTKTTTKTYDDEINEGVASRRPIRDFQQDVNEDEDVAEPDTPPDISYLNDNLENDQNVVNVKIKMNHNRQLQNSQRRNKSK